jgi:fructose-1,6-bisphosphatase/inositol monophosphatase family enzyme
MHDDELVALLRDTADAVSVALGSATEWGETGGVAGQHHSDLVADAAALAVLRDAPVGIVSEESGTENADREVVVVIDPLDGSTNASRGIPWYACSLCAVDGEGSRVAVVADLVHGTRYEAVRGRGATRNGEPVMPTSRTALHEALLVVNGYPATFLGWAQFRVFGAAALDLCEVACGMFDGFLDCSIDGLAPWDYLGAALVCQEAGVNVVDVNDRALVDLEPGARRKLVAAPTPELVGALAEARRSFPW